MIFDSRNGRKATVHVLDTGEKVERVLQCDSDTAEVTQAIIPLQIDQSGAIQARVRKFAGLWPIYEPGRMIPTMIHCYGEVPQ